MDRPICLLLLFLTTAAQGSPSLPEARRNFREAQAAERRAAAQELQRLQAHLDKTQELRSRLLMPQDGKAEAALNRNLADDRAAMERETRRLARAEAVLGGAFAGMPQSLRGRVERQTAQGEWEPVSPSVALLAGEKLRTLQQSSILLLFEDGLQLRVAPESTVELLAHSTTESRYALHSGRLSLELDPVSVGGVIGRTFIETPSTVIELFKGGMTLWLDGANRSHLQVDAGRVHVIARRPGLDEQGSPWWLSEDLRTGDASPLLFGKWLRVLRTEGPVQLVRPDGIGRKATISAEIPATDSLVTGIGGRAWGFVDGGYRVALRALSRLQPERVQKRLRLRLKDGTYYFTHGGARTPDAPERPLLISSDSSAQGATDAALEVSVHTPESTDWIPLEGSIDIRAGSVAPPRNPAAW